MTSPPDDADAQAYFTEEEWSSMVTIEKNRITNILRSYKRGLAQGVDAKPPDFIVRYENRKKQELILSQHCKGEASFGQSPHTTSNWVESQGQTLCDKFQEGDPERLYRDNEIKKENEQWGEASTDFIENFSDFCQYCYIFKQVKCEDSENKLPSFGDCFVNSKSEVDPLKPCSSQSSNNCSCGCQSPAKTQLPPLIDDHKIDLHCPECGQKFAKRKYLKNHIKRFSIPDEDRPFKCLFCSHSFVHEKNRKFHERVHNSKPIPCCHCSQSFVDLTSARIHINEVHQNRVHICNECGMNYSNSSHLLRHKREVRKTYPHQCIVCGHRYLTAVALSRHEFQHRRVKPFTCRVCLKVFSSKTQLKKHLNSQNTEKKYECPSCKVKFLAHKSLKKHERIFNGDRPFKCTICGHAYNTKSRLTIHMKMHYKEQRGMWGRQSYVTCFP